MSTTQPCPETCVHHWMLPSPNGRVCVGKCKFCGKVKTFYNSDPHKVSPSAWARTSTRNKA
jgi:hypothetical protein